jgi:hypothetical protein
MPAEKATEQDVNVNTAHRVSLESVFIILSLVMKEVYAGVKIN